MGHLTRWKVLESMIHDMRRKGFHVPTHIISDLRNTKTLISVLKADPNIVDTTQKVEEHLRNLESYLISEGEKLLGGKYVNKWIEKMDKAGLGTDEDELQMRFISGLPRRRRWIRIKISDELSVDNLKALANESNLSYEAREKGFLIVYGKEGQLRDFVKKIAKKCGFKGENTPTARGCFSKEVLADDTSRVKKDLNEADQDD